MSLGKVYLVGAGPGDPDLITVKALRLIQRADVLVYDRLIPHSLLDEAPRSAEKIDVGKAPKKQRLSQEGINRVLVESALAGKMVVRLKGGDPLVFGRGGEEALACYEAGVPFEFVPGISSSYAVPTYAGIPLTHREISRSFTVITGHENPDETQLETWYEGLVKTGGTLVILMGVYYLPQITQHLIAAGLNPDTPAAMIEWGTVPHQRVVEATAATLAQTAQESAMQSPAISVIGEVVKFRSLGMDWFVPQDIQVENTTLVGVLE